MHPQLRAPENCVIHKHSSLFCLPIGDKENNIFNIDTSGLYYKPMTIVNDDSRVVNKLEASLTDNARVLIYDRHIFMVEATGVCAIKLLHL